MHDSRRYNKHKIINSHYTILFLINIIFGSGDPEVSYRGEVAGSANLFNFNLFLTILIDCAQKTPLF